VYPAVVIARSERREEAAAFIDFLAGDEAAGVFRQIGFEPVATKK
jgi:ABC-type molybdate transport system substrate-binding protein